MVSIEKEKAPHLLIRQERLPISKREVAFPVAKDT